MHWVLQFFVHHRNVTSLLLTVTLSLWMITRDGSHQARISRTLTFTVFYPFQFTIHQATRIKNIFRENQQLRQRVTELNTSIDLLREQSLENRRLRDLLGFSEDFTFDLAPARVVVRDPSYDFRSVVINAGRNFGLTAFMPVVNNNGVVGKIIQVLPHISLVQLLKDPSNRISVMTRRSRLVGILESETGSPFFVHYRTHADVIAGDTIVTSGLGGIYPRGLGIGVVTNLQDDIDPLFKKAFLEPSVDFERIEEVFVIRLSAQWQSFCTELDSVETIQ